MGWTSYRATHYKNGKVDRKAEMDERWTQIEGDGFPELNVLKSRMIGSVYYAAIEVKRSGIQERVFGQVSLTSTKWNDGMNFGYKDMGETMGPYYYDCPASILNLLTETDNEYALEWRRKCRDKLEKRKRHETKDTLPVGSVIEFKWNNEMVVLEKMSPKYQFKRPWWYRAKNNTYASSKRIPENFRIIKKGA